MTLAPIGASFSAGISGTTHQTSTVTLPSKVLPGTKMTAGVTLENLRHSDVGLRDIGSNYREKPPQCPLTVHMDVLSVSRTYEIGNTLLGSTEGYAVTRPT